MKGIIKSRYIDVGGLKLQLAQAMSHIEKAESILRGIDKELSHISSQREQARYEALKMACEEYYDYCGSGEFSYDGLRMYEDAIIEKAMEHIYDDRVFEAIREMIGSRY